MIYLMIWFNNVEKHDSFNDVMSKHGFNNDLINVYVFFIDAWLCGFNEKIR